MQQGNRIGLAAVLVYVFTPGLFADTVFTFSSGDGGTPFTKTVNGLRGRRLAVTVIPTDLSLVFSRY
jgi:hypothetical protein